MNVEKKPPDDTFTSKFSNRTEAGLGNSSSQHLHYTTSVCSTCIVICVIDRLTDRLTVRVTVQQVYCLLAMAPQNHVLVDPSVFDPAKIPQDTIEFNQKLMDIMRGAPKWYEVSENLYYVFSISVSK